MIIKKQKKIKNIIMETNNKTKNNTKILKEIENFTRILKLVGIKEIWRFLIVVVIILIIRKTTKSKFYY